jgi:hypothetical protein
VRADAYGAGVGGGLLKAAAFPKPLPRQPRNVISLCVLILPPPS